MIEIDNKKMWEYMAKFIETAEALKGVLKERNLQYNPETNEIDSKLWTIQDAKDGDVLNSVRVQATIIFKGFADDGKHILAYCALQKGIFISQEMFWDRDFELASEYWKNALYDAMTAKGYEWDADKKNLKKIESQRMVSAEAKESLLPDRELNEFEKELANLVGHYYICKSDPDTNFTDVEFTKEYASELLSIARKQIADEIDMDAMVDDYDTSYMKSSALSEMAHEHYRQGIEETLNKIKKGE